MFIFASKVALGAFKVRYCPIHTPLTALNLQTDYLLDYNVAAPPTITYAKLYNNSQIEEKGRHFSHVDLTIQR